MRIPCPHCGLRGSEEFSYFGDAAVRSPDWSRLVSTERWIDYVYFRENEAGEHLEWWHHLHGCRSWIAVVRNTKTHEIASSQDGRAFATNGLIKS